MVTLKKIIRWVANIKSQWGGVDVSYGTREIIIDLHGGKGRARDIYRVDDNGEPGWGSIGLLRTDFLGDIDKNGQLNIRAGHILSWQDIGEVDAYSEDAEVGHYYWAQWKVTYDDADRIQANATIQRSSTEPELITHSDANRETVYKWVIGQVDDDGQWVQRWIGAIPSGNMFTPKFADYFKGDNLRQIRLLAPKTDTSEQDIGYTSNDSIIKFRLPKLQFGPGGLNDHDDGSSASNIEWYGKTESFDVTTPTGTKNLYFHKGIYQGASQPTPTPSPTPTPTATGPTPTPTATGPTPTPTATGPTPTPTPTVTGPTPTPTPTVTGPTPTPTPTPTGGLRDLWLKCSDGTFAARFDAGNGPGDDYAWLCLGGIWVKCYRAGDSDGSLSEVDILEQCGSTPGTCDDLVGWPASDGFDSGCDSLSADGTDFIWSRRWSGSGTYSIAGGKLAISYGTVENQQGVNGNFTVSAYLSSVSVPDSSTFAGIRINRIGGSTSNRAYMYYSYSGATAVVQLEVGLEGVKTFTHAHSAGTFEIYRNLSNKLVFSVGGSVLYTSTNAYTGVADQIRLLTGPSASASYDDFTALTDGNEVIVWDPTGVAC